MRINFFKYVLIVILTIQPVFFSYAMASMHHMQPSSPQTHATPQSSAHTQHNMHHNTDTSKQGISDTASDGKHGSLFDNCCDTSACGFAAILDIKIELPQYQFTYNHVIVTPKASAELAAEIRPPKNASA